MNIFKRAFDIVFALTGLIITFPVFVAISLSILWRDCWPIFYISERMKAPDQPFLMIKFRTMSTVAQSQNIGVTGGDKAHRVTSVGHTLRHYRLDELPQLINVLRGDMSFVGPRPPLRKYTDDFPDLYSQVLRSKPGVTGLATLLFHRHEESLIAQASTPIDSEHIYTTRCIPRKARLDLIYQRHASFGFDAVIIWQTLCHVLKR